MAAPTPTLPLVVVALLGFAGGEPARESPRDAHAAFGRLRGLVGDWQGSFEWSGARRGSGALTARYSLTGAGSALVEELASGGTVLMTSVYHLDGPDLRMTHFCAAGNQPRLRATEIDLETGGLTFSFLDVTNLARLGAGHVRGLEVRLNGPDELTLTFTFTGEQGDSRERIELRRVGASVR
jgi:hypothetical protein